MYFGSSLAQRACVLELVYVTRLKLRRGELLMLVKVASAKMIYVVRVFLTQSTLALNVKYQFAISDQRLKIMREDW